MNKNNILIYAIVFFMIFVVEFGLNSYLSFKLEASQYLFYQNIINALPMFTALVGFGTPFAVVYMTSLSKSSNKVFLLESNLFTLYFSLILLTVLFLLYQVNCLGLYIVVALILGFFNAVKQNCVNYFLAKKDLNKSSFVRLNQKLIYLVVIMVSLFLGGLSGNLQLSTVLIVGEVIGFAVLLYKYKIIIIKRFTKIKSVIKISKYSFMANLFSMISLATPVVLLNFFNYPATDIISFSIAYTLLRYSGILLGPFMQLITPYFTPIKNDPQKVMQQYKKFFLLILSIGLVTSTFMYFISPVILGHFFDAKYHQAVELFKTLSFAIPLLFLSGFNSGIIASVVGIRFNSITAFIGTVTIISLSVLSLTQLSFSYIVYSVIIQMSVIFGVTSYIINRKIRKGLKC